MPTKSTKSTTPSHEDIRKRAYEISQSEGGGDPVRDWLEAERELTQAAAPKPRRRKPAATGASAAATAKKKAPSKKAATS